MVVFCALTIQDKGKKKEFVRKRGFHGDAAANGLRVWMLVSMGQKTGTGARAVINIVRHM